MRVLIFVFLLCSFSVNAAKLKGHVSGLVAYETGGRKILLFKLNNSTSKGCNTTARFAFDQSKVNFDLMSSTILSAYHAKTPVEVNYDETCNIWGNSFDARFICLGDIPC